MRIIEWPEFLEHALPLGGCRSAITVGVFDGVHRGHKALIQRVVAHDAVPVVVTFRQGRHKTARGSGQENPGSILSFRQKMAAFEALGVSITVAIEFSESFRRMSGADFLRILHEQGSMGFLAVGSNFRCGYRLDTGAPAIQAFCARQNIPAAIAPMLAEGSLQISSSQIRAAIARGDLKAAEAMLGRPFTVDLGGAPASPSSGKGLAFDIASQGRMLPPPGRYGVYLLGEKEGKCVKAPAEICVDEGNIIIDRDESAGIEYVAFF